MKKLIFILAALVVAAIGGYCYYYYYVDEVTERYLVKIRPPMERESTFGTTYSDPKVEISKIDFPYEDDSAAVANESKKYKRFYDDLLKKFGEEDFTKDSDFMNQAKLNAYKDMLAEDWLMITISETRNADSDELLETIKKHGIDSDETKEYIDRNKIKVSVYSL